MTEIESIKIARELLENSKVPHEDCTGARRLTKMDREVWVVFFKRRKPPEIDFMLQDTVYVEVDSLTGTASIFPTL